MDLGASRAQRLRLLPSLAVVVAAAAALSACGADARAGTAPPAAGQAAAVIDAKKAQQELDAGLEAHAAGDLETAAAKYWRTLRFDPRNKFAYYNLALIDQSHGNFGLAEEKYRQALKTDPTYQPALFNLAILRTSVDPQEAIGLYRAAVAADKKDAAAWMNLGLLLRSSGDRAAGDEAVARALVLDPTLKDPAARSGSD